MTREIVRVAIALTVAELLRSPVARVAQVQRHRLGAGRVLHRSRDGRVDAVGLRGRRQVDRGVRQVEARLGQPHVLHGLGRRDRHDQRHGVGEADVLAGVDDQPAGDEPRVLPGLDHPRKPEERTVGIGSTDRLDERADHVVVRIALAVVDDRLLLHGVGGDIAGDLGGPGLHRGEGSRVQPCEPHASVAAGHGHQVCEGVIGDREVVTAEASVLVGERAAQQGGELLVAERLEPQQAGSARAAGCSTRSRGSRWWRRSA